MAHWLSVLFNIPEAQRFADLAGIETNLRAVERICELFNSESGREPPDRELLEIMCAAALVRYGRTIATSVRSGVPRELIDSLEPESGQWHKFFKDARDKWVAHSVNTFEQNEVSAWLMPPERGPIGVFDVTVRQQRVTTLGLRTMSALKELSIVVREKLKILQASERDRVLAIARSLPPEPFYSQVDPSLEVAGKSPPGKPRRRK